MQTTFQDDLETVNVYSLRASGAITAGCDTRRNQPPAERHAHRPELRVVNREFPNSGGWSFFVAACLGRTRRRRVGKSAPS